MRKLLKDHFIPHKGNDHQPHFLRTKISAGILALVLLVEAIYLGNIFLVFPKSDYFAAIFATVLVDQTNEKRVGDHLAMLTPNPLLEKAARMKAEDMAAKGYFAHNTPDGKTPWYWFKEAGYSYVAAGENLAVNFTDSSDVTEAWMQSPSHRANIMNGNYTEIGIGTAEGIYKGRPAIFVVEEFGRPTPTPKVALVVPTTHAVTPVVLPASPSPTQPEPSVKPIAPLPVPPPTTSAPTLVAGAETSESSIISEQVMTPDTTIVPAETTVPSAYVPTASPVTTLLASPRHMTAIFYLLLSAILALALGLAIFIEIRVQHAHIIFNGLMLIALISSLLTLNATIGIGGGVV